MKLNWAPFVLVIAFSLVACENIQRKLGEDVNSHIEEQMKKVDTLVNEQIKKADTLVNQHIDEQLKKVDSLINNIKN
jgi:DNA anti-recombination protein RmuC